jgi:hypothetical protein
VVLDPPSGLSGRPGWVVADRLLTLRACSAGPVAWPRGRIAGSLTIGGPVHGERCLEARLQEFECAYPRSRRRWSWVFLLRTPRPLWDAVPTVRYVYPGAATSFRYGPLGPRADALDHARMPVARTQSRLDCTTLWCSTPIVMMPSDTVSRPCRRQPRRCRPTGTDSGGDGPPHS